MLDPFIVNGKLLLFFNLKIAPNLLKGSETLLKSLLDKLLSPINFMGLVVLIKSPRISRPNVPEFSALIVRFFYIYNHLIPYQKSYKIFL